MWKWKLTKSNNKKKVNELLWDKELEKVYESLGINSDSPISVIKERVEEELNTKLKIGFFGSPGCGKSTLMNKIIGENITDAGVTPGIEVTFYEWGRK